MAAESVTLAWIERSIPLDVVPDAMVKVRVPVFVSTTPALVADPPLAITDVVDEAEVLTLPSSNSRPGLVASEFMVSVDPVIWSPRPPLNRWSKPSVAPP